MHEDIEEILFNEAQIQELVDQLGSKLSEVYKDTVPLVICNLKGAVLFMADLVKKLNIPLEMDFMATSSYGSSTHSSGNIRILKDLDTNLDGRHVLIVEDVIDSGLTLKYIQDHLLRRNAASVRVVALLDKPGRRRVDIAPDYYGAAVPDKFIVGYGLDYAERYRNLPYIGVLKREVYKS
ncbi:MAG: hpt [Bacilli bacterium]|nr:hpt [Bacilli bacterium]